MKISIESNNAEEMTFTLTGASVPFANLIRRYAINSVPVFAISEVAIYENNSSFFDEYITHRLGLIPLSTPSKAKEGEEVTLMLDASGPGVIYAESLKSTDKNIMPLHPKMPIIKLLDEQNIRMECKAVLAPGKVHARHQPGMISYEISGDQFKFKIESYGQMRADEILKKALAKIKESAEKVESSLEE
ncbi:MAG: DNA-directed RNA polymerase subunit D [Candidatus Micrarchaeota archaeon]|nr:DNA-directed RNA polymerase subunit D [Candidatus Micrarchaeota archaeon]